MLHRSAGSADITGESRFHKLNGSHVLTWAPPDSPVKVEYSSALLRAVRVGAGQNEITGVLFGVRGDDHTVRVVAARPSADQRAVRDPRLTGLEPVGIFASRLRGEVFLTEDDLQRFENAENGALVALVVAGTRAGFFVHEPDGSLQSIKSHLEFEVADGPPPVVIPVVPERPKREPRKIDPPKFLTDSPRLKWGRSAIALALVASLGMATPWLAQAGLRAIPRPPLRLAVREEAGTLRILWNPAAIRGPATLEIRDGAETRSIDVRSLSSLSYSRRTGDVEIRLDGESAHFIGPSSDAELAISRVALARENVAELDAEAQDLKTAAAIRARRVAEIQKILSTMDLAH